MDRERSRDGLSTDFLSKGAKHLLCLLHSWHYSHIGLYWNEPAKSLLLVCFCRPKGPLKQVPRAPGEPRAGAQLPSPADGAAPDGGTGGGCPLPIVCPPGAAAAVRVAEPCSCMQRQSATGCTNGQRDFPGLTSTPHPARERMCKWRWCWWQCLSSWHSSNRFPRWRKCQGFRNTVAFPPANALPSTCTNCSVLT